MKALREQLPSTSRERFSMQMAAQSQISFCGVLGTSVTSLEEHNGNERSVWEGGRGELCYISGLRPLLELSFSPFLIVFLQKLLGEQGWYDYKEAKHLIFWLNNALA